MEYLTSSGSEDGADGGAGATGGGKRKSVAKPAVGDSTVTKSGSKEEAWLAEGGEDVPVLAESSATPGGDGLYAQRGVEDEDALRHMWYMLRPCFSGCQTDISRYLSRAAGTRETDIH